MAEGMARGAMRQSAASQLLRAVMAKGGGFSGMDRDSFERFAERAVTLAARRRFDSADREAVVAFANDLARRFPDEPLPAEDAERVILTALEDDAPSAGTDPYTMHVALLTAHAIVQDLDPLDQDAVVTELASA